MNDRPVICWPYAARGMTQQIESLRTASDYVGQHRSHYQLRVVGAIRLSTGVVSNSFFESDTTASEDVGSVVYNKIQSKRTAQTNNYMSSGASVIGQLANFVK